MGFFADVRELRARMKQHLADGAGNQALIKAIGDGPLGSTSSSSSSSAAGAAPPSSGSLPTHADLNRMIDNLPDRISTEQLKDLLAAGAVVRGKKA